MRIIIGMCLCISLLCTICYAWTVYVCPKCGSPVDISVGCSIPPVTIYKCTKCNYIKYERDDVHEVVAPPMEDK